MSEIKKYYVSYQSRHGSENIFDDYEEAVNRLKIKASQERDGDQWCVYQAVAKAEMPIPDINVVKIA